MEEEDIVEKHTKKMNKKNKKNERKKKKQQTVSREKHDI